MQNTFSNALSEAASKHIALSPARRETLARLPLTFTVSTNRFWGTNRRTPFSPRI
ncbi:MAG: hypothetical protein ACT4O2_13570 [Beijerinckiaceae bacterium]